MQFNRVGIQENLISAYAELMRTCFPTADKFDSQYLEWLYKGNPDGLVIGMDAWDGSQLAAHYVCIPLKANICGSKSKVLLSLNTATHPNYQGKGLFTRLAEMTYDVAAREGFDAVYGVANANSTPGFVRKLGFQLVQPLEARVGVGSLNVDFTANNRAVQFQRAWSPESLIWRCANPNNQVFYRTREFGTQFYTSAMGRVLQAYAELPRSVTSEMPPNHLSRIIASPCRLFLGLFPASACEYRHYFSIPQRLRPSPLNFIYRSLSQRVEKLDKDSISLSFLDFDAY